MTQIILFYNFYADVYVISNSAEFTVKYYFQEMCNTAVYHTHAFHSD